LLQGPRALSAGFWSGVSLNGKEVNFCLTRNSSAYKIDDLRKRLDVPKDRLEAIQGDLIKENLGLSSQQTDFLRENGIDHFFHLAAVYDLMADEKIQNRVNVEGTRYALKVARKLNAGCFHHVSSVSVAGLYKGTFSEAMFEEATDLDDPYFHTKHESERLVRASKEIPWRVYRPSAVVGHSETGQMDKVDGPYYLFPFIRMMEAYLPSWIPLLGIRGGLLNIVPVDFVAAAMDHIAHQDGLDCQCFHLTDPNHHTVGEVFNIFCRAAGAPKTIFQLNISHMGTVLNPIRKLLDAVPGISLPAELLLREAGLPPFIMKMINYETQFDCSNTLRALSGSGISVPDLNTYSQQLWDYWYWHLNTKVHVEEVLKKKVRNKRVLITGASSGIGRASAIRLASAGARVLLVARSADKLRNTEAEIKKDGWRCVLLHMRFE